ncbi:MAG: type II toxin-antitoxin system Phd/YefM family antitoxin [Chloroflexota bacterium]
MPVKVVNVTEVRQDATRVIREAQESGEPVLVVQRSRPAAYVVSAERFDALQAELHDLRRREIIRDVREAEIEAASGSLPTYDDVHALMDDLESAEPPTP